MLPMIAKNLLSVSFDKLIKNIQIYNITKGLNDYNQYLHTTVTTILNFNGILNESEIIIMVVNLLTTIVCKQSNAHSTSF